MKTLRSLLLVALTLIIQAPAFAKQTETMAESVVVQDGLSANFLFYSKVFVLLLIALLAFLAYRNWRLEEK